MHIKTTLYLRLFSLLILVLTTAYSGQVPQISESWPQWMGPERNGIWNPGVEIDSLKQENIEFLWESPVGTGYCGPTVSDGKVFVMDYIKGEVGQERVQCFDLKTGEVLWVFSYPREYTVGYPTVPRASVLIENNKAYSYGTMGDIHCFNATTGEVLWHIDGLQQFNVKLPIWGLASAPLIYKELLIVQLGGTPNSCIVAFEKNTGKVVWTALSDLASYSSPIIIDQSNKKVLVCWTGDNLVGMNPDDGSVYWKILYERNKSVINIAMPVLSLPYIFLSSFYDGSMLIKLREDKPEAAVVWKRVGESERKTDALHSIISTPFIQGENVYGIDSYGEFRCLDLATGDRIWTDSTLTPYGRWSNVHFAFQEDKFWAFNEKGELVLGKVSPEGFSDLGRVHLIDPVRLSPNPRGGVNWAAPAFAGRKIIVRSDAMIKCFELVPSVKYKSLQKHNL